MRYLVILAWCVSLTTAYYCEHTIWNSGSILQARQFNSYVHFPRAFPLRNRDELDSLSRSPTLRRRTDKPAKSNPSPPKARPRHRSSSPTVRAAVHAAGPATISMSGSQGEQNHIVAGSKLGFVQDKHKTLVKAGAKSFGAFPARSFLQAEATGGVVMAQVIPHPGATGTIQFHGNGEMREIPVQNQVGEWHNAVNPGPGKAFVRASTLGGGEVNVFAYNEDHKGRRHY